MEKQEGNGKAFEKKLVFVGKGADRFCQMVGTVLLSAIFLSACSGLGEALSAAEAIDYPRDIPPLPSNRNQGIVYFFGRNEIANNSFIYEGTKRLGVVGPRAYTFILADPGTHTYTVKLNGTDTVSLDVEPGVEYFRC